ncbi:MAG: 3-isopropylmalate dehydratase small subunit [Bacteroidota bacterium]
MSFEPIKIITGRVVALPVENIDTDRIIPARFLKAIDSEGFGNNLFFDWRYLPDGSQNPDFVLNKPEGQGIILLAGKNFGCGSSREHAAWALYQYGFRVIISSGFADIFRNNALNNGLLPIEVSEQQLSEILAFHLEHPEEEWSINLQDQTLSLSEPFSFLLSPFSFSIHPFRKRCLLEGLDLIDYLYAMKPEIIGFEQILESTKILS